ncbi:polyamine deacetylase HDAC10 [Kryptolebias marmoratus]|uniref:Histone deacetylase 10 n=1 Tax=Kryptolebias marmoratus TaxID=37003 RepID=A0A3Q3B236_KRYMA|nr:polyamine deacetylase HDAC10 [Kryptolebias marmoratus]
MGTALIYDEEMTKYKLLWVDPACKIETPERLTVSYEALVRNALAERCISVPVREATNSEILLVHSEEYLEAVKKTPYMTLEDLKEFTLQYGDVYFHPNIYHCAKLAAGSALQLVDCVMTERVRNGMALVRPPGHHSQHSAANGFCVFNNVAIATRYAKQKYGVKRVLIVDWDIHHGQGVQYCFEDDPSVLYFSWHRYEHQTFWPQLRESDYDSVGKEKGAGFNINVPWNQVGMESSDYLSVFCHVLLPVAYEFCPDLVLVCAGFDSAIGDPEGKMCATPEIFAHLTHLLMNLAGGKLCVVLEGGYNLTSLAQSVCQTVQTLLGDPLPRLANLSGPCRSALESLQCVRSAHRQYWSCLKHAASLPPADISTKRIKLAEEEAKTEVGEEEKSTEEKVWPEPPKRFSPPVRCASVLPDDVTRPDGCKRLGADQDVNPLTASKLKDDDCDTLSRVITLVEKMEQNEICSGLALVCDVTVAMTQVVQHLTPDPVNRVLIVCVGNGKVPSHITRDGKTLVVQINSEETEDQNSKYYIPVFLKKGCSDTSGFMHAVFGLILPLGYEYDPNLVLLVRMPDSGVCDAVWQQLTGLLQSFAKGHTLVLMQENEKAFVGPTTSVLLGDPAPPLENRQAPNTEDLNVVERLRDRLQVNWNLLQTTSECTGAAFQH